MPSNHPPFDPAKKLSDQLDVDFVLKAAGIGIWAVNPVTNQIIWDDRCRELFGLTKDNQLLYEQVTQYIHSEDRDRVSQAVLWAVNPISDGIYDQTYRTLGVDDKKLRWIRFQGKGYFSPDGKLSRFTGIAQEVTQQMQALEMKEEGQRQLLTLLEQSPVGLASYSADDALTIQWANPFFGKLVGRLPQTIMGRSLLEALPELEGQGFDIILKNVILSGIPFIAREVSVNIIRDGQLTTIYVNLTYQPKKGHTGTIENILVVATDVTQQVTSRKKVEESEAQFRSLVEEAPVATCLFVGREMIIEIANTAMIDVWGKGTVVIGMPLALALPELQGQHFLPLLDELFTTGNTHTNKAGRADLVVNGRLSTYYFNYTFKPLRNSAGQVYAILETAVDVTQQVLAQQQLKQTEESLRSVIEVAEMGTWELNIRTGLITYSDRLKRLFEFKEDTIEMGVVYNPIYEPDRLRVQEAMARAADPTNGGLLDEEYRIISQQTQQEYVVRVQAKMYFDISYQPQKMIGAMRDITQQRQLQLALEQQVERRTKELAAINEELITVNEELATSNEKYVAINEKLEEANSLLNQSNDNLQKFAYVASHDLQEPLRKIQSFGDLLRNRFADQLGEGVDYLTRMQVAANRMSTLIRDLLTYSRITSQRDASDFVSLNEVVSKVLIDLELFITETGASIYVEVLPDLPGDSSQLGQLFQNLVTNAIKFRRPGIAPVIQINARLISSDELPLNIKPSRRVAVYQRIEVADNGIGFDEKYLDRIFQVFQRLHGRSEITGTGIGLAICEKVATSHGGAITATSQVGHGATFSVYLPA